jgi:hypothetical protein
LQAPIRRISRSFTSGLRFALDATKTGEKIRCRSKYFGYEKDTKTYEGGLVSSVSEVVSRLGSNQAAKKIEQLEKKNIGQMLMQDDPPYFSLSDLPRTCSSILFLVRHLAVFRPVCFCLTRTPGRFPNRSTAAFDGSLRFLSRILQSQDAIQFERDMNSVEGLRCGVLGATRLYTQGCTHSSASSVLCVRRP